MASATTQSPDIAGLLSPLLPSLPAAALSSRPADSILPLLSPILRQRVQLLSEGSSDPYITLLCYDPASAARLKDIAQSERLELHPVSGEVEVDWDYDAETRYRRVDEETLQALVVLGEMELAFRLVYCTGDPDGGDGWKVGEVSAAEKPSPFSSFGGVSSITEADRQFNEARAKKNVTATQSASNGYLAATSRQTEDEDDDDDDYWAQYDATPSRTPATKRSPAPGPSGQRQTNPSGPGAEDDYYAQYDSVQPAMDNHDPDEEANLPADMTPPPPLGLTSLRDRALADDDGVVDEGNETREAWTLADPSPPRRSGDGDVVHQRPVDLVHPHPRPPSSTSSRSSVERLEAVAERREQGEFGVKQHIARSIKSLYMLARASGIDRPEFDRLIRTEIDMLALMED